jgi:hypothetical protein
VAKRLGDGLEWAASQARRAIHDNDIARLTKLLAEYPALLSWRRDDSPGGLLGMAASAYGDSFDPARERNYTRAECAELLIDAGVVVVPSVVHGLIESRARGLLQLCQRKGLLPRTLEFFAALGDIDAVRVALENDRREGDDAMVMRAFMVACRFEQEAVASVLLDRVVELDPELGKHVDESGGRQAFIAYLSRERSLEFVDAAPADPWQAFLMEQAMRAVQGGNVPAFTDVLRREPWMLGEACIGFQVGVVERATLRDHGDIITALLGLDPALGRKQPPPPSQAIELAIVYAKPHLIPILTRIWAIQDDLPHAAGTGDLARVQRWFDASGAPVLGDLTQHYPFKSRHRQTAADLLWNEPHVQHVLDSAFAWAVINRHFDVADFLVERGADVDTTWGSHEPASILHELVFHRNYESMRYLVDRGIDMTITDHRWHSTAQGWARYAANDEAMAQWLETAERERR